MDRLVLDVITPFCECIGFPVICENTDPCGRSECDPATGGCVTLVGPDIDDDGICYPADPCPLLIGGVGDPCDDGNACTWFDHITADCQCFGQPAFCDDSDPCTLNTCNGATGCLFPPGPDTDGDGICDAIDDCPMRPGIVGTMCDDGSPCTSDDEIDENCQCTGTPVTCDDGDPCTIDGCLEASGCTYLPVPDSDADGICDALEFCAPCADSDPCTYDLCDEEGDSRLLPPIRGQKPVFSIDGGFRLFWAENVILRGGGYRYARRARHRMRRQCKWCAMSVGA